MSLWVVGTDTGVGKTLVCALLLARYSNRGVAYFKPVATGGDDDRDRDRISDWLGGSVAQLDEVYRFPSPVSPHLAARRAGQTIDPETLATAIDDTIASADRPLVIEGAGGVLVPLTDAGDLYVDVVARSRMGVLLVARSTLGTINHTLLTLEALRTRSIGVLGVVLVGPPTDENAVAIERFGGVEIIAEVPPLADRWPSSRPIARERVLAVAAGFDGRGRLATALR